MDLRTIADSLGIAKYPQALDRICDALPEQKMPVCDTAGIEALQREYGLFGEYYEAVLRGAQELSRDPARLLWGEVVSRYLGEASCAQARSVPVPASDGTPAGDMLPLLTLIPHIPASIDSYRRRALPEEEIRRLLGAYRSSIAAVQRRTGRPGIDTMYYLWLCIYVKALIFHYDGFNYELKQLPEGAVILKSRTDGTCMPLLLPQKLHKSGLILGSAACKDPADSFDSAFRETEDGFYGCPMANGRAVSAPRFFSKEEWGCVLRPGDDVLNIHIPRGTDLSREKTDASFAGALAYARKAYAEYSIRSLFCCSWLLDPTIGELLGGASRIAQFGAMFARYPVKSAGREVFSFVFTGDYADYSELPENTRLERALKSLYMDGGCIHAFAGVLF